MLITILLILAVLVGGFFAYRYYTLVHALRDVREEIALVRRDLSQNQMLHLPLPQAELAALLGEINAVLDDLQQERQAYEKRERAFQQQIEAISHDLRTPLTVILGYLKLVRQSQAPQLAADAELTETITVLEQKAEAMKTLVTQFYDYSRLAADDLQLSLDRVDAARILRESLAGNYQLLAEARLAVSAELPEHPVWVLGEQTALERVFQNLLQNAGRYAASSLQLSLREDANQVVLHFCNDTTRLSEADVPRLFERFYLPDDARHQGSSGLGLTVARSLAEEMQGQLTASATPEGDRLRLCFALTLKRL